MHRRLRQLDGRQLATALHSLAQLQHVPAHGTWMREYWNVVRSRLPALEPQREGQGDAPVVVRPGAQGGLDAQSVASLLHAAMELRLPPPSGVAPRLVLRAQQLLPVFDAPVRVAGHLGSWLGLGAACRVRAPRHACMHARHP